MSAREKLIYDNAALKQENERLKSLIQVTIDNLRKDLPGVAGVIEDQLKKITNTKNKNL